MVCHWGLQFSSMNYIKYPLNGKISKYQIACSLTMQINPVNST